MEVNYGVTEILNREQDNDDETFNHKDEGLYSAYLKNPEMTNQVLLVLCGWTYETLVKMSKEEKGV